MATRRSVRLSRRRSKSTAWFSLQLLPWQWAALAALPALLFAAWFVLSGKPLPAKPEPVVVDAKSTEVAEVSATATPNAPANVTPVAAKAAPKMTLEFTKILTEPEKERIQPVTPLTAATTTERLRERVVADLDAAKISEEAPAKPAETVKVAAAKPLEKLPEKPAAKPTEAAKVAAAKPLEKLPEKPAAKPTEKPVEVTKKATPSKMVVRVGSYQDKSTADAKRAELMLNGVQTQVVSYTNKSGKTLHLLQTSPLPEDQAKVIHQRLQLRNYNSQLRNAS